MNKMKNTAAGAAILAATFVSAAMAQTTASEVQRDVNQQQRIEQGLQSGALSTREAAKLEKGEARVERMEAKANRDGTLSDAEKARIQRAQNAQSAEIAKLKHNDRTGNPDSASSRRMQADVQRNVNQQQRIEQGVASGSLTGKETARLERGQARVDRAQAPAGAGGHVGAAQHRRIQKREDHQSKRIHRQKHDAQSNG